jgi:RNA polymerase sigma-70 factor (ECF subfamily)
LALKHDQYAEAPDALLVGLARTGDRNAFAQLVRRRQLWIRNLMRRCCGDVTLADDLSQQVFMKAWQNIAQLQRPSHFQGWLKRIAINAWLAHARRHDPLQNASDHDATEKPPEAKDGGIAMDLDHALAQLSGPVRLCVVLSYHDGMTHPEIAALTGLPLGTVKSHVRRGTQRLQELLAAYIETPSEETPT